MLISSHQCWHTRMTNSNQSIDTSNYVEWIFVNLPDVSPVHSQYFVKDSRLFTIVGDVALIILLLLKKGAVQLLIEQLILFSKSANGVIHLEGPIISVLLLSKPICNRSLHTEEVFQKYPRTALFWK